MHKITAILIGIALNLVMSFLSSAQGVYEIKGLVFDETGPMVGATVMEHGTTNGTSTGGDGDYVLKVSSADAVVEISAIGYRTMSYKASQIPGHLQTSVA